MDYSIYEQFGEWLSKQPYWVQDAVWRMYNNKSIDDKQIDAYVEMCLSQVQSKKVTYKKMDNNAVCPSETKTKLVIKSVENIQNVNALAENTKLEFGENGVSVIYGLNGAGKSGFMRVFKHVSGNPYADPIQKNVYKADNDGKSLCDFKLLIDGTEKTISYDLSSVTDDDYLKQCDVFDTRISGAYITSSNSVSYEPFVFSVLKELAHVADRIEHSIKSTIKEIEVESLSCPEMFKDYEKARWVDEITHETIIPQECIDWFEDDNDRIKELKNLLDTANVEKMIKNYQHHELQIKNAKEDLFNKNILNDRKRNDLKIVYEKFIESKKQYEAAELLFSKNASELDKKSISLEEWKKLWKLGKSYYEKCIHDLEGKDFASDGSVCPLCLQKINGKQQERFSSVDEYVNGNCSEVFSEAKKELKRHIDNILSYNYSSEAINSMLSGIVDEKTLNEVVLFYKSIETIKEIKDCEEAYKEIEKIKNLPALERIDGVYRELTDNISSLKESLNIEKKNEILKELKLLQYRKWVNEQLQIIKSIIDRKKKINEYNNCLSLLKTNRITTESNLLAEALISEAYIERFTKELKKLAPHLKVKLERVKSTKGKSPYKVVLDAKGSIRKNPQDVLSEGEQRIVALAAFFADATGRDELTPIIIDDPISSLDYNYEENATKRIVELGRKRQVIVFTHRISLLVGISEKCETDGVDFVERHIRGTLNGKGVSDFEDIYHGKISTQLSGIQDRIRETMNMDPDSREYYDSCSRISQQLRICIERSVEDVLFQQMVKRFSRRIMTGKLMKLDKITSDDCSIIDSMMSKYSFEEHSQPEDSCLVAMDLKDVIEDIQRFKEWIKEYNKKMG